jgi:adenylate kinase
MILLMGIAGSGKGTQGQLLAEKQSRQVLSTGDLLRAYGSDDQHARMLRGIILGDDEVTAMLDKALSDLPDQDRTIVDGYPRTIKQAEWLLDQTAEGRFKLEAVILLQASRQAVAERLRDRGRPDDHDSAIEARFAEYEQSTLPIIDHLERSGVPILKINGEQPVTAVHLEIIKQLNSAGA